MKKRAPILLSLVLPVYLFGVNWDLTDFDVINHKDKSITGNGTYVGVIDSAINLHHPSLEGQIQDQIYSEYRSSESKPYEQYQPDFSVDTHGSHVAGIIAAKSRGGVEGVATETKIYGVQITGHNTHGESNPDFKYPNVYDYFKDKNVAAINNSWNSTLYPLSGLNTVTRSSSFFMDDPDTPSTYIPTIEQNKVASDLIKLSKEKNILSVFAAGNEGISSPGIMALAPYYDEKVRSMIVVGALDRNGIIEHDDGRLQITLEGATYYSNSLKGAYNFGLVAPGTDIKNVDASYRAGRAEFRTQSGTSMAAPMVTGAAALVAQKFPFMNGKQIADVLLSTANRDYIAPKIVVRKTETAYGDKYTIFYLEDEIPKKSDGAFDLEQIAKDLDDEGYWRTAWKGNFLGDLQTMDEGDYPGVQKITKEELFGQGILDIDKALNGIGILDANRLSDSDVKNTYGETAVYYSLNTQGNDAEFSNDISQRKWEANTHNPLAYNLPTQLDGLNVGLIKTGSGILTLSGTNTYEGATVIDGGEIKLRSVDTKTAQIAGNVYVNNGSTLSGNGIIKKDLTNSNSTVRPGNADLTDLTVQGTYTQKGENSKLILDFGDSDNSQLIAKSYSIETGTLEYNPLKDYYTTGKEITIDLGELTSSLNKFSNVLVAGNQSIKFEIKSYDNQNNGGADIGSSSSQGQNDTTPTIGEASIGSGATSGGSDSSGGDGSLSGGLDIDNGGVSGGDDSNLNGGDNRNPAGSSSGGDTGGNQPTQPNQDSNQGSQGGSNLAPNNTGTNSTQSGQNDDKSSSNPATGSTNPNPSNTPTTNQNNSGSNVDTNSQTPSQNNNTQGNKTPNNNGAIIVTPVVRSDAYASNSAQLSQTMRDIRGRNDLNPQYQQFFATLDSSTQENYKSIMSRIEGRSIGDMTSIQSSTHNNFMQNNMLFSLNPTTSTLFAYNQNPYDSGVLVASVASDYIIDLGLNSATPKDYWYINPTFKRYNGDGFDGYQSGASVNLAQHIGSNGLIAYGIGASLSKLDFDIGATAKSSNFDIALNYTHDFESFKLISGGSFMVSFNENERTVANTLSSDYKSYSSSLQLGVAKDFRHYSIVVTPLGYLGYGKIYQESFKESGGIFAKNYDSINHDIYTVGMGLNLAYEGSDEKSRYTGYIIYERMLDGYNMDASAEFNDFKGQKFSQRYHLDKNRLNLGVGAEYAFNSGYFAKFGIGSEFATTSDNYNLSVTFGKRF